MRMTEGADNNEWTAAYWDIPIFASRTAGILSLIGSSWIMAEILTDRQKRRMCYHRIVFGLSLFDAIMGCWYAIGRLAQPRPNSNIFWSRNHGSGTLASCEASGYFVYLANLAIPFYSAALAMYYYLGICSSWSEKRIKTNFERYVHCTIIPIAVLIAMIPLFLELYNPWYTVCFISHVEDRTRATMENALIFNIIAYVGILSSSVIIFCSAICISSRKRISRGNNINQGNQERRKKDDAVIQASNTAILYCLAFVLTWFVPVVWYLCITVSWNTSFHFLPENPKLIFTMQLYVAIFSPLQGFLNFFIYLRSRFEQYRKGNHFCRAVSQTAMRLFDQKQNDFDCNLGSGMVDEVPWEDGSMDLQEPSASFEQPRTENSQQRQREIDNAVSMSELDESIVLEEDASHEVLV